MRRFVDFSSWQSEASGGINFDAVIPGVDGAWVRYGDYSYVARHGADAYHASSINTFRNAGKAVGSYLFVAPQYDAAGQIQQWFSETPETTFPPMLDLEVMNGVSGNALSYWVDTALAEMTRLWGVVPVFYTSANFFRAFGLSRPSTPHWLMLAEYHLGYQPFQWAYVDSWEQIAYRPFNGPDLPAGYDSYDVWQFTSSAELPGMPSLVDMSLVSDFMYDQAMGQVTPQPPPTPDPPPPPPPPPPIVVADLEDTVMIHEPDLRPSQYNGLNVFDFDYAPQNGSPLGSKTYVASWLHVSPVEPSQAADPALTVQVWNVGPTGQVPGAAPLEEHLELSVPPWGTWWPVAHAGRISVAFDPKTPVRAFVREIYFLG